MFKSVFYGCEFVALDLELKKIAFLSLNIVQYYFIYFGYLSKTRLTMRFSCSNVQVKKKKNIRAQFVPSFSN